MFVLVKQLATACFRFENTETVFAVVLEEQISLWMSALSLRALHAEICFFTARFDSFISSHNLPDFGRPAFFHRFQAALLCLQRAERSKSAMNFSAADGGNYTCVAENETGRSEAPASLSVRLYVNGSQQMTLYTTNESVERIICAIEGFPVDYIWERATHVIDSSGVVSGSSSGEVMLGSNSEQKLVYTLVSIGRVLEFNPAMFGDEGVYRCVAFSILGERQTSLPIFLTSKLF